MSFKSKKDVLNEFESRTKELRVQLSEQLRLMETRMEWESAMLLELNEFYRRRAEIEEQYAKDLRRLFASRVEKLRTLERTRAVTGASSYSLFKFYKTALGIAHSQSVNHGVVAKIFGAKMAPRFTDMRENSSKLFNRCRDMCSVGQADVMENVRQVGLTLKNYQLAHGQAVQAEAKLLTAKEERRKLEEAAGQASSGIERRLKQADKALERRREKYEVTKQKALRERNEYLLQLECANASVRKYFADDLPDILDCMACGFHNSLARAAMMHLNTEDTLKQRQERFVLLFMDTMNQLDAKQDKLHFLTASKAAFTEPAALQFKPHQGDPVSQVCANQPDVLKDLEDRYSNLQQRIKDTGVESDELWKTLEAAEQSWLSEINVSDYFVGYMFNRATRESRSAGSDSEQQQQQEEQDQQELEQTNADTDKKRAWENGDFYLVKFDEYVRKNCNLTRLRARADAISRALGRESGMAPPPLPTKPRKKSIIKVNTQLIGAGRPKLFGGSVDELQEFPAIVLSCVKLINKYGLYHQGVFRIPGSQTDVNRFKEAFERGEDPFGDATDGRDVNAAAGVLKSYLRHLEEPILPSGLFDEMLDCVKKEVGSEAEVIVRLRAVFQGLSGNVYRVLRFLFAFLNHLATFSDENLMDAYNLSICLGPSFMPVPQGRDPVAYQGSVSHLMKLLIEHEAEIFTRKDVPGPMYRKMMEDDFDNEDEEEQSVSSEIDADANYMVTAKYSFEARTPRELSFARGDVLTVKNRVTADWLAGVNAAGKDGYVPDAYVVRLHATAEEEEGQGQQSATSEPPSPAGELDNNDGEEAEDEKAEGANQTASEAAAAPSVDETDLERLQAASSAAAPTAAAAAKKARSGGATEPSSMESIDQALHDVIAGLESLTHYETESPYANPQELLNSKMHLPASKRAPDLVSDLPPDESLAPAAAAATNADADAAATAAGDSSTSAADQFALEGHGDTVRPSAGRLPATYPKSPPKVRPKPKPK